MSPPRPALPSPLVVPADKRIGTAWVAGRTCTACLAWAAPHEQLRHANDCRGRDVQ